MGVSCDRSSTRPGWEKRWSVSTATSSDGGTRTAAITGAVRPRRFVAGKPTDVSTDALIDHVAAVSVGIVDGEILLVWSRPTSPADVDMNGSCREEGFW